MMSESSLQSKIKAAIAADDRYDRFNEVKLRAITETKDYESFQNMVLAADLKPVNLKAGPRLSHELLNHLFCAQDTPLDQLAKRSDPQALDSHAIRGGGDAEVSAPAVAADRNRPPDSNAGLESQAAGGEEQR
jgi:hypothetical protein